MKTEKTFCPDRILSYFRVEWRPLTFITLSGLFYNVGLLAAPWFEGRLAQCLADIPGGNETAAAMAMLVLAYIAVTLTVQAARFTKRFYVRRFANNITEKMAQKAAELAGLDATIRALPEGYHTVCTDGTFSQGEWQLLSIARGGGRSRRTAT